METKCINYKGFKYKIKSISLCKVILEHVYLEDICSYLKIENAESKRPKIEKRLKVRENPSFMIKRNNKGSYICVDSKKYYIKPYIEEWLKKIKENIV